MKYIRTCQECGHKQVAKDPATYKGDNWRDVACKACGSEALDYGSEVPDTPEEKEAYRKAAEEWMKE